MFEGKFPGAGFADGRLGESGEEPLRDLSWSDLAARLAAARDLRASLEESLKSGDGSFDAESARRLSARGEGKPDINPNGLASGKGSHDKEADEADEAINGDRGRQ
jgi:hypothetical protein